MRKIIAIATGFIILMVCNYAIFNRERLINGGQVVYLKLAPVDPRSLMQGDYMALRFEVTNQAFVRGLDHHQYKDGHVILNLDNQKIGTFQRFDDNTELKNSQIRMRYRIRNGRNKFATNAFFFQEGHAHIYEEAKFGEFRVAENGDSVLTGMRDKNLVLLGPKVSP